LFKHDLFGKPDPHFSGSCLGEMMAFVTPEHGFQPAIGAAGGRFFHLAPARIAGKACAC
jgi:hypothetical protein